MVCRIADQRQPRPHRYSAVDGVQPVTGSGARFHESAEARAEALIQCRQKCFVVQGHQSVCPLMGKRPHEPEAPPTHGQQRQRSAGGESLVGHVAGIKPRLHAGGDGALLPVTLTRCDAAQSSQQGASAIGRRQQPRFQRQRAAIAVAFDPDIILQEICVPNARRLEQSDA